MNSPLPLAVSLGDSMLTGHIGYVFTVESCPLRTSCTWCMHIHVNVQHYSRFGYVARQCFSHTLTDTVRFFFAQKDYMRVFMCVLDCLDFLNQVF